MKKIILIFITLFLFGNGFKMTDTKPKPAEHGIPGNKIGIRITYWMVPPPHRRYGSSWNPTGSPIGGGPGYANVVTFGTDTAYTASELETKVEAATFGQTIFILDTLVINMEGREVSVPAGVTVASGRGRTLDAALGDTVSWGALLFDTTSRYNSSFNMFILNGEGARVTGLRLRGSFSEIEGEMTGFDYNSYATPWNVAISCDYHDSVEIDNCEIWGWGKVPWRLRRLEGAHVHHNYIHRGNHVYHGYGSGYYDGPCDVLYEANYYDWFKESFQDGGSVGSGNWDVSVEGRHNTFGPHLGRATIYAHDNNTAVSGNWHHNTIEKTTCAEGNRVKVYAGSGYNSKDTVRFHLNHIYEDSADYAWQPSAKFNVKNNHYGKLQPWMTGHRIPTARIWSSVDSCTIGTAAATVQFYAGNSGDADGTLKVYYWWFGDSTKADNYARGTNFTDTVTHTFHSIGKYMVELRVTDNLGNSGVVYKTINVMPTSVDSHYLSCWIKDLAHHTTHVGKLKKRVYFNNWLVYDKDMSGNESWEHIIVDLTDTIDAYSPGDSFDLRFRIECISSTSGNFYWADLYIDDVCIYGANVVDGSFEDDSTWGSPASTLRSSDNWIGSRNGPWRHHESGANCSGGRGAGHFGKENSAYSSGQYVEFKQRIEVQ